MADNVIPFPKRSPTDPDLIYCPCGDAWWVLAEGAVCFRKTMAVSGWAGIPVCKSCGQKMYPGWTPDQTS